MSGKLPSAFPIMDAHDTSDNADGLHDLILVGAVTRPAVGADACDPVHDVHAADYMAECGILTIEVVCICVHDKELAARAVGIHGSGHADDAALMADGVGPAVLVRGLR